MKRIPSLVALAILLPAAAAAVGLSLFAGGTLEGKMTWDIRLEYRLPRGILAFLVGASLGASGVCFQGLFRNSLADPFVVGVSSGAALGAVAAIVFGLDTPLLGLAPATACAFAGALGAAFLAYSVARVRGRVTVTTLLLAGSAIGSFAGAMVSILILINGPRWGEVVNWLMGSTNHPDPWTRVKVVLPCLVASTAAMVVYARDLNLVLMGEESARQLGVETERLKVVLLGAGALAAAGAVATCGMIGFVGLIVPHVCRRLVGPDHRLLLPVALLAGGILLTIADAASRTLSPHYQLPIGAVTALGGAPFFVYILRRRSAKM
ncbi:MAG: iron chelate uptake ABC transporter family permease subunit [Planctomycetes bacterium]|nr:iron chelate uptake ABC transporter family permease subunit [Planctomycetota bacterium]